MALSPSQKKLLTRAFSAVIAVLALVLIFYFFQGQGLKALCIFAVVMGTREITRILFFDEPVFFKIGFSIFVPAVFVVSTFFHQNGALGFAIATVLFTFFILFKTKGFQNLEQLTRLLSRGILGAVYVGVYPSFAYRLLDLTNGTSWFFMLLAIVLVGDTTAYLAGSTLGKNKINAAISPNKTVEGGIGGLVGSVVAASTLLWWRPETPIWLVAVLGLSLGLVAQLGDFFESLLKRVANRKDSGSLMPGHGGILDRLDGVLFAAPFIYLCAEILEKNLI